jgi:hypothetical protein
MVQQPPLLGWWPLRLGQISLSFATARPVISTGNWIHNTYNLCRSERTKHCYDCQCCVAGFDHHCIWLGGKCIGEGNYRQFMLFLTGLSAWCGWVAGFAGWLVAGKGDTAGWVIMLYAIAVSLSNLMDLGWCVCCVSLRVSSEADFT